MLGGTGNDTLVAGQGGSTMSGGEGNDTMTGAIGSDYITSEKDDADTFIITDDDGNFGYDNISGFNGPGVAGGDVLRFEGIEKGTFTITEHYGFGGVVYFDKVVGVADTAAPAATDKAATLALTDPAPGRRKPQAAPKPTPNSPATPACSGRPRRPTRPSPRTPARSRSMPSAWRRGWTTSTISPDAWKCAPRRL